MFQNEITQNKIGKAFVRQSQKESSRLLFAKMLNEREERIQESCFHTVEPLKKMDPDLEKQVETIIQSKGKERYLKRLDNQRD